MKILLDECCHRRIRRELDVPGIDVATVQSQTWHGIRNGGAAAADRRAIRRLRDPGSKYRSPEHHCWADFALIVLKTKGGRWHELQPLMTKLRGAIAAARPGSVVTLE